MIIIKKRTVFNFVIFLIIIILICFGFFFYRKLNKIDENPSKTKDKEASALIQKVSKLYLFPEGEVPTIATVSDPNLLKDKEFFTQAIVGDNVLLFLQSGKAVLYRPSINKIIEIAPIKNNF